MTDDFGVLEWSDPYDCEEIRYNVKQLLVMMKPRMKHFYQMRARYTAAGQERRPLQDESEDEDGGVGLPVAETVEDDNDDDGEDEDDDEDSEDEDEEDEELAKISGQKRERDEDSEDESPLHKKPLVIRAK